ncbi:hypothetical protein [uncultured Methanoregula sp.]|uniref:hypothetical protein n=1 Tax=uncultured Methanoregula sp. TaxID=1005933 RepID=UPI002AAB8733|nr:hypothetical protein [uncultured Methanoregula sp.]
MERGTLISTDTLFPAVNSVLSSGNNHPVLQRDQIGDWISGQTGHWLPTCFHPAVSGTSSDYKKRYTIMETILFIIVERGLTGIQSMHHDFSPAG